MTDLLSPTQLMTDSKRKYSPYKIEVVVKAHNHLKCQSKKSILMISLKGNFQKKKSWICNGAHGGILHPLFFCRMCEITSFTLQEVPKSQGPLGQKLWNI